MNETLQNDLREAGEGQAIELQISEMRDNPRRQRPRRPTRRYLAPPESRAPQMLPLAQVNSLTGAEKEQEGIKRPIRALQSRRRSSLRFSKQARVCGTDNKRAATRWEGKLHRSLSTAGASHVCLPEHIAAVLR